MSGWTGCAVVARVEPDCAGAQVDEAGQFCGNLHCGAMGDQESWFVEMKEQGQPEVESSEGDHAGHDYPNEPRLRDLAFTVWNLPRWVLLMFIRAYQATLSKMLPSNTCRFYPSCSHYGYQAVYKYGALKGGLMAAWRVLRCNPFNPGGYDPVP